MKFARITPQAWLLSILFCVSSCTEKVTVPYQEDPEPTYCTTNATFTPSYTITGTAEYQRRRITGVGLSNTIDTYPIRGAEIQVINSSGSVVQCSETEVDNTGDFSFTVPQDGGTYTVKIFSRSYSAFSKASVLQDPYANIPYEISTTFVADSAKDIGTITASSANNNLVGGAFNILDRIFESNDYLLNNTGGAFVVDHKVQAYWAKGVNPVTYFNGDPDNGVSFYVPGTDKLYILGGINGDVTIHDTDHYDDSVIIHEYAHFLEDNYSISDSPGGAHYGTYAVDPRLAWSEGFATFFSTQVLAGNSQYGAIYKDTIGIAGGFGFYYDAENNQDAGGDTMDPDTDNGDDPLVSGEGGFRELGVLRFLWAALDGVMGFSEFWDIYTHEFVTNEPFREMSLFLQQQSIAGTTDLSALYGDADKEMDETRSHYGTIDLASANDGADPLCRWVIQASEKLPSYAGSTVFERSNPFFSNDFFYHYHAGGTLSVTLTYDLASLSTADLDLYVYRDGYSFGSGSDLLTYSNDEACSTFPCTETVSTVAPAGHYMINVMYYNDGAGSDSTLYNLRIGGSDYICK